MKNLTTTESLSVDGYKQLKTNKMKELQKLLNQVEQFKSLGYESHYYQWHTKRIFELKNKLK